MDESYILHRTVIFYKNSFLPYLKMEEVDRSLEMSYLFWCFLQVLSEQVAKEHDQLLSQNGDLWWKNLKSVLE